MLAIIVIGYCLFGIGFAVMKRWDMTISECGFGLDSSACL